MASDGKWHTTYREKVLNVVPKDDGRFFEFKPGSTACFGTRDLKGCSAVLLVSPTAGILAHIAPGNPHTGVKAKEYFGRMMVRFIALANAHREHFAQNVSGGLVAYALLDDGDYSEEVLELAKSIFKKNLDVPLQIVDYYAPKDTNKANDPPRETVLIDPAGGRPNIYVEDQLIFQVKESSKGTTTTKKD